MVMSLDGPGYGDGTCTNANGEYSFNAAFDVDWRMRAFPMVPTGVAGRMLMHSSGGTM